MNKYNENNDFQIVIKNKETKEIIFEGKSINNNKTTNNLNETIKCVANENKKKDKWILKCS